MNKLIVSIIVLLLILLALGLGYRFFNDDLNKTDEIIEDIPIKEEIIEPTIEPEPTVEPVNTINTDMFYDLDSILILVNKKHDLPSDYEPNDLVKPNVKSNKSGLSLRQEAALAIEEMFNKALEDDITLVLGSSYRSYSYQSKLYNNYVAKDGEEKANKYSAKPGQSEHQTGLAADISDASGSNYLKQSFKDTPEGIWLKDNAHNFGFILRYPEGKEEITGYMFEPWHFRYVGIEEATKIYNSNLTFEEYYNILD